MFSKYILVILKFFSIILVFAANPIKVQSQYADDFYFLEDSVETTQKPIHQLNSYREIADADAS